MKKRVSKKELLEKITELAETVGKLDAVHKEEIANISYRVQALNYLNYRVKLKKGFYFEIGKYSNSWVMPFGYSTDNDNECFYLKLENLKNNHSESIFKARNFEELCNKIQEDDFLQERINKAIKKLDKIK